MSAPNGMPGLRGIEHIGISVPDLQEALTFLREAFGWEPSYRMGPFADPDGDWMSDNFDVHPRAEMRQLAVVRTPFLNLELIEGTMPEQRRAWPRMLDIGGTHLNLYVDDVPAAIAHLEAHGCRALGDPKDTMGPEAGEGGQFCHVITPFGLYVELMTYPHGRAYEAEGRKLWNPAEPDLGAVANA